jgi:hypothetical protein
MIRKCVPWIVFGVLLSACHVNDRTPEAVSAHMSEVVTTSPTLGTPIPLPFENEFPDRWNPSNNGSPYEPCVAFSDAELIRFQIDPALIEDAAIVDGQGIRGCRWFMRDKFSISQLVTNSESLRQYREGTPDYEWKDSLRINDHEVGLFDLKFEDSSCSTYVQSYSAAVVTTFAVSMAPEARADFSPCGLVIDFTTAYIDKIPG